MVPLYYVSMFETKLGIILACGPAIRQFLAYRQRAHTSLPSSHRQYPNEDVVKMRRRVNLRDIFWYREARLVGNRVFDATPMFKSESPPPEASKDNMQGKSQVTQSVLDIWEKKIKRAFGIGRAQTVSSVPEE